MFIFVCVHDFIIIISFLLLYFYKKKTRTKLFTITLFKLLYLNITLLYYYGDQKNMNVL